MTQGHDLGRGATLLLAFTQAAADLHADLELFHAPGECHRDVRTANARSFRMTRKRIKAATGLRYRPFLKALRQRTSARWVHFNLETWTHGTA